MPATTDVAPREPNRVRYIGDYEIEAELARGGMGVVYKARQLSLDRPVALKMILAGEFASDDAVRRFQLEAKAAGRLEHPNIVAIHEVGTHEGRSYYSMDYVPGEDLARVIARGALAPERAAEYLRKVALAVQHAHDADTLHRDIKPQNILIDDRDEPRVTDFGLAKMLTASGALTSSGAGIGTPGYMPPEQVRGNASELGPASDVYSLGAVLYECLTGRRPFASARTNELLRTLNEDVVPPSKLRQQIPQDLETICLRCLEKQPTRRYPSALALAEELARFLAGEPILARPPSIARKSFAWAQKHPWWVAGIVVAAVFGLLATVYGLWSQTQYLEWVHQHPEYVRTRGKRTAHFDTTRWFATATLLATALCYAAWLTHAWSRSTTHRRPSRLFTWCGAAGATANLIVSAWMLTAFIDAWVWEAMPPRWAPLGLKYPTLVVWYAGVVASVRLLRAAGQMLVEREIELDPMLSRDERERVLRSIRAGDRTDAVRVLRAVLDTNELDAGRVADRMAASIGAEWRISSA